MEYRKLLRELRLPEPIISQMESLEDSARKYLPLAMKMTDPANAFQGYQELNNAIHDDTQLMLACQLLVASEMENRWQEKGIAENIYLDTMGCYRRFLGEAVKKTGKLYFDRGWWTYRQLSMVIFRLGQLEFEMLQDHKAIAIHIPSDSVIEPNEVESSILAAKVFFKNYFPERAQDPMICHSWLLSPQLQELLPDTSRIKAFARRFRILKEEPEAMDCLEWLFQKDGNPGIEQLPENTSLQRNVKNHLLNGGKIGVALGVLE